MDRVRRCRCSGLRAHRRPGRPFCLRLRLGRDPGTGRGWLREPGSGLAESWTTVDGRSVRSLHAGSLTEYPEVVILPGLGAPFYVAPWAEQIAGWTRVVVLDLPGWRGGRARSSPPSVAGLAKAAAGWLTETGRQGVVLAGHSSGAQSALRAARLVPERLRGVVLAGPTLAPGARRALPPLRRVVATLAREELPELSAVIPSYLRSGGLDLMRLIRSIMRDQPEDATGDLVRPVLVMIGERDRVAPPSWAQHLAHLSDAPYLDLPGAHNTCFTFPRNTNAALQQTITKWAAV